MVIGIFVIGVVWVFFNALQLKKLKRGSNRLVPVSVCVPLRNEEEAVHTLIHTLKQQRYDNLEVLLYDDESTDQTVEKVQRLTEGDVRFKLIQGIALDPSWKGKPHACYQLAKYATGRYLLFIDADVTLYRDTISAVVKTFQHYKCDAISGFPAFINNSILEKLLTPLLHFFVYMHLPIRLANKSRFPAASAASGAFLAMTKKCYEETGGHALVKNETVEDVALFRMLKRNNYKAILFNVTDYVKCSMYGDSLATWNGFLKNCFAGFNNNIVLATGVMMFYLFYFVAPLVILIYGVINGEWLYVIPYFCITVQRIISDIYSRSFNGYSFLMPLSSVIYVLLLVTAMGRYVMKRQTTWKGRSV